MAYRDGHWKVGGNDYYGNHLLLQRIYEDTQEHVDKIGERTVGLLGPKAIEAKSQADMVKRFYLEFSKPGKPMENAILAAERLHKMLRDTYAELSGTETMTLGLDDLLMGLQSAKEEHLYLLQQALQPTRKNNPSGKNGLKKRLMR